MVVGRGRGRPVTIYEPVIVLINYSPGREARPPVTYYNPLRGKTRGMFDFLRC